MKTNTLFSGVLFAFSLMIGLLLLGQCSKNTSKNAVEEEPVKLLTHEEAKDTLRKEGLTTIEPVTFQWLPATATDITLDTTDLAQLFRNDGIVDFGFYGTDRYRIDFYFSEVSKDPNDPRVYLVKGKNRYKKNVTAFSGTFTIDSLARFKDANLDLEEVTEMGLDQLFSATGRFELFEDSTATGSGAFRGRFEMDYSLNENHEPQLWYFSETPNRGSGIRFIGNWQSYKSGKTKPVIWAKDLFRFANDILKDFSIGEREVEINEAYRKLGWDNYWENEEWWAEPAM